MTRTTEQLEALAGIEEKQSSADMKSKAKGKDIKPGKVKKFNRKEVEAWAKANGLQLTKESMNEAKLDMDRVKKGVAHSMKKNDMRSVSKIAKEVLRDGGQKDFDDLMDFIVQMAR